MANSDRNGEVELDLRDLRVLIIDDNAAMRGLVRGILRNFYITLTTEASDGKSALDLLRTNVVDLIISDMNMAPMNGIKFVHHLRGGKAPRNAHVPVIMLTGHSEQHLVLKARDSGINEFLMKPVSPKKLYERISEALTNQRTFVQAENYIGPDRRRVDVHGHGHGGPKHDRRGAGTPEGADGAAQSTETPPAKPAPE